MRKPLTDHGCDLIVRRIERIAGEMLIDVSPLYRHPEDLTRIAGELLDTAVECGYQTVWKPSNYRAFGIGFRAPDPNVYVGRGPEAGARPSPEALERARRRLK